MQDEIPFNHPYMTGKELQYIESAHQQGCLAGDGPFTTKCHNWLERYTGANSALLAHSCTAALEMSALLLNIEPGDEIIMPSYTFVSTANAFVLRGGIPVFVDIRTDTLNIDETLIEQAITSKTKAILPVHYAGVACEMDTIMAIAKKHNLCVVEDAAQGVMSKYKGQHLGAIGDLGTYSFHETKNVISGEGGALLVNRDDFTLRAEIIREKGTDRSQFFRGQVDKYSWRDIGSSFLPGELIAAFLWAQLEHAKEITDRRMALWNSYHSGLEALEVSGLIRRPIIPEYCEHNAHMYYVLVNTAVIREKVLKRLNEQGVCAVFHYVPLHSSVAGEKYCRADQQLDKTDDLSSRIIRLPLYVDMSVQQQEKVIKELSLALSE